MTSFFIGYLFVRFECASLPCCLCLLPPALLVHTKHQEPQSVKNPAGPENSSPSISRLFHVISYHIGARNNNRIHDRSHSHDLGKFYTNSSLKPLGRITRTPPSCGAPFNQRKRR